MRVDPFYITNLVGSLDQTQLTEQKLTEELSSGVRFHSLSDDPISSGRNVLLLNQIQQDDSFTQSSSLVTGQMQVADSALGSVVSQLTQALSLAISANNGTMNGNNLKSIAGQLTGILNEVEALANTSYQGQYVFAGGQTGTVPFSTSNAASPGVPHTTAMEISIICTRPMGRRFNSTCREIRSSMERTVCSKTLNNLIADYASGTINMAQATADTEALNTALQLCLSAARYDRQLDYATRRGCGSCDQWKDATDGGADKSYAGGRRRCCDSSLAHKDTADGAGERDFAVGVGESVRQAEWVIDR